MRLHPEVFAGGWDEAWLAPELLSAVKDGSPAARDALLTRHADGALATHHP